MKFKVGQVYNTYNPTIAPYYRTFTITKVDAKVYAKHPNDTFDWELNTGAVTSGYYKLETKLEKALK